MVGVVPRRRAGESVGRALRAPRRRTSVRRCTRVLRRPRNPRSECCVPLEVPLRHVEPSM
jgi:hypothetical protein